MTDQPTRAKPAMAAKVMVTGASLTSVLAMTAAMGRASSNEVDEIEPTSSTSFISASEIAVATTPTIPLPSDSFADLAPTAPIVGHVVPDPVVESAPVASSAPLASPTPIVVQIPTPAPAPSASTSKSR